MSNYRKHQPLQKLITGYRPIVRAREGRMLGMRQSMDGPIFEKLEDAQNWCIHAMISHFDRRLGMSDARIEPFKGMVDAGLHRFGTLIAFARRRQRSAQGVRKMAVLAAELALLPPFEAAN